MNTSSPLAQIRPRTHQRYLRLPIFGRCIENFVRWSLGQGYKHQTLRLHLEALQHLVPRFLRRGIRSPRDLTADEVQAVRRQFKAEHDDYNAIMAEALADRLAEAFAEFLHQHVRQEWGYGKMEKLSTEELIAEKYCGIRPAAGYPACPDHTEKGTLWRLLNVEKNAGIKLTESFAMWPGSSVSGLYFAHPESKYFAVGKLDRDQVLDYHRRKGMTLQEVERWLGPYLNYDPLNTAANAELPACACGAAR